MQALAVVDLFEKAVDRLACLGQITVAATIHLLLLERLHEALRHRVVVRTADAAHARLNGMGFEPVDIVTTRILHATIRMMHQQARALSTRFASAISSAARARLASR